MTGVWLLVVSLGLVFRVFSLKKSGLQLFYCQMRSRCLVSSNKLSGESQTSCARLVNVLMVVALCKVGVYDMCRLSVNCCPHFVVVTDYQAI